MPIERELAAASELLQGFFHEGRFDTPPETVAAHVRSMHRLSDLCLILLAIIDDDAVAVATVSLDFGIEFGWQAEIGDLYVVPPARRQGLALRLIEAGCGLGPRPWRAIGCGHRDDPWRRSRDWRNSTAGSVSTATAGACWSAGFEDQAAILSISRVVPSHAAASRRTGSLSAWSSASVSALRAST